MDDIKPELKLLILKSLKLDNVSPTELSDDQALLDGEFGIDSIDILQLIVDIERKFNIKLVKGKFDREIWKNVNTLSTAIQKFIDEKN
ncbi:MAG: hypothetical protein A2161_14015 [Candidatus Schekmanbacteria bacterium RBG_13_48_7]|uniref:Carrier domain-containing protein n=1 Tax=Candidatus Schekmanbacteria bacterium RBG_13_48_7 TaxID=1817878 RepID=A0A1F7RZR4_9BACT|nr:MAG: hypothetical protein A2161_14015 [Candidatus Schekmanbacteria bacterium RBG_13_48_7]